MILPEIDTARPPGGRDHRARARPAAGHSARAQRRAAAHHGEHRVTTRGSRRRRPRGADRRRRPRAVRGQEQRPQPRSRRAAVADALASRGHRAISSDPVDPVALVRPTPARAQLGRRWPVTSRASRQKCAGTSSRARGHVRPHQAPGQESVAGVEERLLGAWRAAARAAAGRPAPDAPLDAAHARPSLESAACQASWRTQSRAVSGTPTGAPPATVGRTKSSTAASPRGVVGAGQHRLGHRRPARAERLADSAARSTQAAVDAAHACSACG